MNELNLKRMSVQYSTVIIKVYRNEVIYNFAIH